MEEGYQEVDLAGNFTFFNKPFLRIFGYSRDEMMGTNFSRYAAEEEIGKKVYRAYNQMYKTGIPLRNFEWDVARKDGARRTLEFYASLLRDSNDRPTGFRGIVRDITERRRAEKELQKSEQRYRLLVENANEAIMVIQDGTVKFVNEKAVETFGYSMQELQTTPIFELVHPDDREQVMKKYLEKIQGDTNPTQHTYRSLHKSGQNQWVENNSVMIEWEGRPATLNLITNITERKEMEKERQENLNQLRKSLGATIDAMAATVETRDPYTAGHQRRVADLARAIATEMNLESNRIDGLRMASKIHDIGKISVPSEILTKPTKLTNLELELIKTHSASGYNVLKDIDFPWPIARMVLEHHERMDGSGYPNGLKGEQILLESRILAVADVVEAISSNRPYRASYGINAGLEEVSKHKGTTYDAVVVDACLKLFQEKGYKITN
jgi:PAS domain S-box-containing protein